MEIGPLQFLVVGLLEPKLDGSILDELVKLSDNDVIKLVDLLGVFKDEDGTVLAAEFTDLSLDESMTYGAWVGAMIGLGLWLKVPIVLAAPVLFMALPGWRERARFVASAGGAIAVALGTVLLARIWHLTKVLDFPGLSTSQLVQTLVFTLLIVLRWPDSGSQTLGIYLGIALLAGGLTTVYFSYQTRKNTS